MHRTPIYRWCRYLPLIFLGYINLLNAQVLPPDNGSEDEPKGIGGLVNRFVDTDSFKVNWVSPWLPLDTFVLSDSDGKHYFHQYDPARRRDFDLIHLGMPGTACRPILWEPAFRKGNQAGVELFDNYRMHKRAPRRYLPETAFSNLTFLRGSDQDDYYFEANAGIRLQKDILFSLDYERLPQIGEYRGQRLRNTAAVFTLSKSWNNDKVISTLVFGTTEMIHENNGGITRSDLFEDPVFNVRANVPVYIDNSQTTNVERSFTLHHRINLLRIGKLEAFGEHELRMDRQRFKFYHRADFLNEDQEIFYATHRDLYDRGFRMAFRQNRTENHLRIGSNVEKWSIFRAIDWRLGYELANVRWNPDVGIQRFTESYLHADAAFKIGRTFRGKASYSAGFFDAANNTRLHLEGSIHFLKHLYLQGSFDRMRLLPSLMMSALTINFQTAYDNTGLSDPRLNTLAFRIGSEKWNNYTGLSVQRNLNWVYFNENLLPEQLTQGANLLQFYVFQPLQWKVIHWDHAFAMHQGDIGPLGAVKLFYKSSLYYEGKLLSKSSLFRAGIDFRYLDTGSTWTYHPLMAQWIYLPETQLEPFYELDVFVAMKVKVFKVFFRFENMVNAVTGRVAFMHARYPMQDSGIRLGIQWLFVN
jgi:hypothetical protein